MASRPAGTPRVFISHQRDADIRSLLEGLRDRGTEPYVLSDVAVLESELLDALREAVERADLVVVLDEERALNSSFEAGVAYALGKPLLLIVPPGTKIPSDLAGQIVVRARPGDLDAINFVLDQVERRARLVLPAASGPSERALGPAVAAEFLDRLRRLPRDERSATALLVEAIEGSGAIAAANLDPDVGFDVGVWSDDLAAIGGNPLVVEVNGTSCPGRRPKPSTLSPKPPTARLALVVHLHPSYDDLASAAMETVQTPYPVLTISLEELIRRMASASFAEVVRDLRNQSVHGPLPS